MSIIICGDPHFGFRNNIEKFVSYQSQSFYTMIDYAFENKIKDIILLGDIFDNRRSIYLPILNDVLIKFKYALDKGINITMIAGNHDVFYKNTNKLNSPKVIFDRWKEIDTLGKLRIIDIDAEEITYEGVSFLLIPWLTSDNSESCIEYINKSMSTYCLGHFEINGFTMNGMTQCTEGLDQKIFSKFKRTLSGHFHTRSKNRNITYVGSMVQMTWADFDDKRGFWTLDPVTDKFDFISLNHEIFHKVMVNDNTTTNDIKEISNTIKNSFIQFYLNRKLLSLEYEILEHVYDFRSTLEKLVRL